MGKALILALSLLTGCTTIQTAPSDPRQVWCDTNKPRRDATESTPRSVIDEINSHNQLGQNWCGWEP